MRLKPHLAVSHAPTHPDRDRWYELDNAATLFPAVASPRITTLFRIAATLTRPVNVTTLQTALDNIMPRFPYYRVELKAGFFWHYLSQKEGNPRVVADSRWPCMTPPSRLDDGYLFRVRAFGRRVAVEFSHILTDGTGALTFLRALLLEYFLRSGVETGSLQRDDRGADIFRKEDPPDPSESEDAYRRYFTTGTPGPERMKRAFRLSYALLPVGVYKTVTGIIPLGYLSRSAKEWGVSITVFLASILAMVIYEIYREMPAFRRRRAQKYIRLEVPVNLRRLYETKTMRNFSLFVMPGFDLRLGEYDLKQISHLFHHFMKVAVDERFINQQIARNIRAQLHPVVRAVPLALKMLMLPHIYFSEGEGLVSSVLTNLGIVEMPGPVAPCIERFDFVPAPSKWGKTGCGVISYGEHVSVTFGRMVRESEVERRFFKTITGMGIPVRIKAN